MIEKPTKPWLIFFLLGAVVAGGAFALQLTRPTDGLKSLAWFLLLGAAAIFCDAKLRKGGFALCWSIFCAVFVIDMALQGVVRQFFGSTPQPDVLAQALANTNTSEAQNFLIEQKQSIARSFGFVLLSFLAIRAFNQKYLPHFRGSFKQLSALIVGLVAVIIVVVHFNPTMLRQQPFLRWVVFSMRNIEAQKELARASEMRRAIELTQPTWGLASDPNTEKTVVVVMGESSNRNNWSQYGYARPTTVPLEEKLKSLPGHTVWFAQAKSSEAFTMSSLEQALTPADKQHLDLWKSAPDVFMLAKASGYRIAWLSNQPSNEGWLSLLGKTADYSKFINNGNWRDSSTTDMDLLPELQRQLSAAPPTKELIVIHELGQHFHYAQRCPKGIAPYQNIDDDAVMQLMKAEGRSDAVRQTRNEYDNAVYCGAVFLSEVLTQLQEQRKGRDTTLVYFSDHGQEVGHTQNFAGHSTESEQGYTIPLFVWHNGAGDGKQSVYDKPYSLAHFDHLLQRILGISSVWYDKNLDPSQAADYPQHKP